MTKRIFRALFLMTTAVLLASLGVIMGVLYQYFLTVQKTQLQVETALAVQGVEAQGLDYLQGLRPEGCRLTWIAPDGQVLYDSQADPATMDDHSQRQEVAEALEKGSGESSRYSATLAERTLYRAELLEDGTVLRLSMTQHSITSLVLGMAQPISLLFFTALLLSALLAFRLSRRIVDPLNDIDLDHPLDNDTYEEIAPLLGRIERQHRQIAAQMDRLKQQQNEFAAVTANMSEGLILLSSQGTILSINPAAARLFRADGDRVGQDMLTVDRSPALSELLRQAQQGISGEITLELLDGLYQLDASPVRSEEGPAGVCLLAFDVTEKSRSEQQRREFSANVSHELKTPLHTIMGAAELIENGLVQPEDISRFGSHIRSEAARLVRLIEDIIRLSQLDEGGELPREEVDLAALARDTAEALSGQAEPRHISLEVQGQGQVCGVRRLLQEIIYDLCDNAIKYNVDGGSVKVTVETLPEGVRLTVADSGVGIAPEHQQHVFERFYRVDKSHSRETGGTGLGLSIVKHAAQYHKASLELDSQVGQGTSISLLFPADQG